MTLYSLNGAYPASLPFRITLPNGRTRTDPTTFTAYELSQAGYTEAPEQPAYDPATQQVVWSDGEWNVEALPSDPVPVSVTRGQAKLALHRAGLLELAEAEIAAADAEARIYWQDVANFRRDHPLIAGIGSALGLADDEIDHLFRIAATL